MSRSSEMRRILVPTLPTMRMPSSRAAHGTPVTNP